MFTILVRLFKWTPVKVSSRPALSINQLPKPEAKSYKDVPLKCFDDEELVKIGGEYKFSYYEKK